MDSITLASGQISITKSLAVDGGGSVTLNGGGTNRIFGINAGSTAAVGLIGLAFTNGVASGANGGAVTVDNAYMVGITNCMFTGCSAANGGVISTVRRLALSNCRMTRNMATTDGGCIYFNEGVPLVIDGGWYSENTAGGKGGVI